MKAITSFDDNLCIKDVGNLCRKSNTPIIIKNTIKNPAKKILNVTTSFNKINLIMSKDMNNRKIVFSKCL